MNNLSLLRFLRIGSIVVLALSVQVAPQEKHVPPPAPAGDQNPFQAFQHFSATMNGGMLGDRDHKIYRSGNLMRVDFEDSYRITDLAKLTMWGVHRNECVRFGMPDAGSFPFSAFGDSKVERSLTEEKETVNGHLCRIENVTFTNKTSGLLVVKMKLWEAEDLEGFPLKVEVRQNNGATNITYRDVSLKTPDPTLFKRPLKCTTGPHEGQKGTLKLSHPASEPLPKP